MDVLHLCIMAGGRENIVFEDSEKYKARSGDSPNSYKWCFVPQCANTTLRTPGKLFFHVKRDEKTRKMWFQAARRESNVSSSSVIFCCEDHFNVSERDNLCRTRNAKTDISKVHVFDFSWKKT